MDPLKEYGLLAMILILIAGVIYFAHDERRIGAEHNQALQRAADAKEAAHVSQVEGVANATNADLQARFTASLAVPTKPAVVVRVCHNTAGPPSSDSPSAAGLPLNGASGSGSAVGDGDVGIDIAPFTETILKRDAAVISYLQGYIRNCQTAGVCAK